MKVITNLDDLSISQSVVCVGNFDGLHRGHREIVDRTIFYAKQTKAVSVVFSFWPHPQLVLNPNSELEYLCTYNEKVKTFENTGVDILILFPFSREFAGLNPEFFIKDYLIAKLKMQFFVIGYDHQYGKDREGNYQQILELSKELDFGLERVEQESISGIDISSTKIRSFIKEGYVEKANLLLSEPFFLIGKVEEGLHLGSRIGFPTANIWYPAQKIVPKTGVYIVEVEWNGNIYSGIANLGTKPTVSDKGLLNVEVHIFNFIQNIYGQILKINFLKFIRAERRFPSVENLKEQIQIDIEEAHCFLNS